MKIGALGGTFDPIHYAHLISAEYVRDFLDLDKILFIPASVPPHKDIKKLTPPAHRMAMIHLAISDNPSFEVCDIELQRGGISYSLDTILALREKYQLSRESLYFIIGSDSLEQLHTWHEPERICETCTVVVVHRPGFSLLSERYTNKIISVDTPLIDISASHIRERIRKGRSVRYLTPLAVCTYINDQKLYRR